MEKPAVIYSKHPALAIHLLGPFRIAVNGAPVGEHLWTRRKSKTLVKLLALQPHRQLHRHARPTGDPALAGRDVD